MGISSESHDQYNMHYENDQTRWRDLGALGKSDNIVRAWSTTNLSTEKSPRVVEIGCGDGAVAANLADRGFFSSYLGFDIAENAILAAERRGVANATFETFDGSSLPIAAETADLVLMTHVVEHLEDPRSLLIEARRIAPVLIVEVPTELHFRTPEDYDWDPVGHINKYDSTSIRHLVQTCRWDVVSQFTTNPAQPLSDWKDSSHRNRLNWRLKNTLLKLRPSFANRLFTYHETIIAYRAQYRAPLAT